MKLFDACALTSNFDVTVASLFDVKLTAIMKIESDMATQGLYQSILTSLFPPNYLQFSADFRNYELAMPAHREHVIRRDPKRIGSWLNEFEETPSCELCPIG